MGVQKRPAPPVPISHGHPPKEPQPVPATTQACHISRLSRSPNSPTPPLGVLWRMSSHPPPLSFWLAPRGSSKPLVPTLVKLPGQNPWKPLHLLWILDPSREGDIQSKGHGSPPATPGGTSSCDP